MAQIIADPDGAAMRDARDAALRGDAEAVAVPECAAARASWPPNARCERSRGAQGAVPLSRAPLWLAIEPA